MNDMTMKEISDRFQIPYSLVVEAALQVRNGKRQRQHNVKYSEEEIIPFLFRCVNLKIDNAEKRLGSLKDIKRRIESAISEEKDG